MEKTELEKRWDEELTKDRTFANEGVPDPKDWKPWDHEVAPEFEEEVDDQELDPAYDMRAEVEDEESFQTSPLADDNIPLVIVTNNNRVFIGGLINIVEGGVILDHPMAYVETADARQPGRLQIGVQKIFHGLAVPSNMWVKHDSLNMLKTEDSSSQRISSIYEKTFSSVQASDAGVEPPSPTDLQNFALKKQ